ncbi:hypothetical protein EMIT093MI4_10373 [Pseudomonas sp. IT-93MI4]
MIALLRLKPRMKSSRLPGETIITAWLRPLKVIARAISAARATCESGACGRYSRNATCDGCGAGALGSVLDSTWQSILKSPEALKWVQATGVVKVRPIACSDLVIGWVDHRCYIRNVYSLGGPLREQARSHN